MKIIFLAVVNELDKPLTSLKGIGPTMMSLLAKVSGGTCLKNILFHLPTALVRLYPIQTVYDQPVGTKVTFKACVKKHQKAFFKKGKRMPYVVFVQLATHMVKLLFFNARQDYLMAQLPLDHTVVISGRLELFHGVWQITHPDHIGPLETFNEWVGTNALYPLTQGLTQKSIKRVVKIAQGMVPVMDEWISPKVLTWHSNWPCWNKAIRCVHNPRVEQDLHPLAPPRQRLAYDELLSNQIMLQISRTRRKGMIGCSRKCDDDYLKFAKSTLPFTLTQDQLSSLVDIRQDMARAQQMNRMVQGDVGSGKTVVAYLASLVAKQAGYQTALLAPTELLARQHYTTLESLAKDAKCRIDLLLGKDTKKVKTKTLRRLQDGETDLIIGTHALFQEEVNYKKLGLAIIDEQHRFGVDQRLKLMQKGHQVDLLSMTATPIPRSLMLTAYGDMDSSQIRQKPEGRKDILTKTIPLSRFDELVEGLKRALKDNHKIYWVCPLIEDSEKMDLAAAEDRYRSLETLYPGMVGLVHGRMSSLERDATMNLFIEGKLRILVATTVIEVGVNVTDATLMVIEHAERFGLAQLHQLRGRVGRSSVQGTCLLLYADKISEHAKSRLRIMRETNDGFLIAEEDWNLRGGGELLGVKQSGLPKFHFVDWVEHRDLLKQATYDARELIDQDPQLETTNRGQAAKKLLHLFNRSSSLKYIGAG